MGEFEPGDIFFLGANLPHTFQKSGNLITSAVVVHFRDDFWGKEFLDLPESKNIKAAIKYSFTGIKDNRKKQGIIKSFNYLIRKRKRFLNEL